MDKLRKWVEGLLNPIAIFLLKIRISPNILTIMGFFFAFLSSIYIYFGNTFLGGILILVSGFFDVMDGFLARVGGLSSKLGGFLDSVFDRFSDALIFSSIIYSGMCDLLIGLYVLVGSFLISYIRCKGECLNVYLAGVGLAERSERLLIVSIGLLLNEVQISLYILSILVTFTIIERFYRVVKFIGD
ncbi:MAG: archaetidylinositol phosphate synthase [Candidatus Methanomethylicia archaeon]